jgi:hypothetical protein
MERARAVSPASVLDGRNNFNSNFNSSSRFNPLVPGASGALGSRPASPNSSPSASPRLGGGGGGGGGGCFGGGGGATPPRPQPVLDRVKAWPPAARAALGDGGGGLLSPQMSYEVRD